MASRLQLERCSADQAQARAVPGTVALRWLGQAGFFFQGNGLNLMIDPYLSDSLARKYQGTEFPHVRRMAAPLQPHAVEDLDWVLCTHRHSDHMDPDTLGALASANPACRFVVPRAEREQAISIGLPPARTCLVNAGEELRLSDRVLLDILPSAHEQLRPNSRGEHHCLGYVLSLEGMVFYHSGDCVPYERLAESLLRRQVEVALLPVNGRNPYLSSRGILGNFSFEEATALCRKAEIPLLICHHWGMFDFNTVDPEAVRSQMVQQEQGLDCHLPTLAEAFLFARSSTS